MAESKHYLKANAGLADRMRTIVAPLTRGEPTACRRVLYQFELFLYLLM